MPEAMFYLGMLVGGMAVAVTGLLIGAAVLWSDREPNARTAMEIRE